MEVPWLACLRSCLSFRKWRVVNWMPGLSLTFPWNQQARLGSRSFTALLAPSAKSAMFDS